MPTPAPHFDSTIKGPLFSALHAENCDLEQICRMIDAQAIHDLGEPYLQEIDKVISQRVIFVLRHGNFRELRDDAGFFQGYLIKWHLAGILDFSIGDLVQAGVPELVVEKIEEALRQNQPEK